MNTMLEKDQVLSSSLDRLTAECCCLNCFTLLATLIVSTAVTVVVVDYILGMFLLIFRSIYFYFLFVLRVGKS